MLWQGKNDGDESQSAEIGNQMHSENKDQNVTYRKPVGSKGEDGAGCYRMLKQQDESKVKKLRVNWQDHRATHRAAGGVSHPQREEWMQSEKDRT